MIDFKGMKKVSETPHKATFQHPAGHKIHIAKAALHPEVQKQISAMPIHNFDEGGQAGNPQISQGEWQKFQKGFNGALGSGTPQQPSQPPKAYADGGDVDNMPLPNQTGKDRAMELTANDQDPAVSDQQVQSQQDTTMQNQMAPDASAMPQAPAPSPQDDRNPASAPQAPADPNAGINAMPGGSEALQAANMQAGAVSGEAQRNQKLQEGYAAHQQEVEGDLKKSFADTTQTINQVTHDIMNDKINPNHYLENKSTGSKIATAIGLLFGGMGAARTGGQNPALQFLQSQIQRDLEAQKSNMDQKHNLLTALERQYNNKAQAAHMFAAIDANVLASKVGASASQAASPIAKAAQLQAVSQLKGQAAQYQRQALLAGLQGSVQSQPAGSPGMDARAQAYLQAARVVDPKGAEEFQKRYIPNVGVASVPLEDKDREFIAKNTELRDLYQRAQSTLQEGGKLGPLLPAKRAEAANLQQQMQLRMGEIAGLNRFTGEENHIYSKTVPDLTGTHLTGSDKAKLNGLMQSIDANLNTFYQQKGINRQAGDRDKVTVLSPNGQSGSIPRSQLQTAVAKGFKPLQ